MDWLWALGLNASTPTIAPVENALDILGSYGFNHFLVSLYSNYSAWSGSLPDSMAGHVWWAQQHNNTPWVADESGGLDYSQLNLRFLRCEIRFANTSETVNLLLLYDVCVSSQFCVVAITIIH